MMKKFTGYSIFLSITFLLVSCFDEKKKQMIIGEWTGVEWISDGTAIPMNVQDTKFTFDEEGNYTLQFEGNIEKGKYAYANNQIFTTPEGGTRVMVKIDKLTEDTLIFNMNKGVERLTLVRQ